MYKRFLIQSHSLNDSNDKVGFHGAPLIAAWLPIVNFAVLVAAIKWHKYSFYAHLLLTLIVIGLTLAGTLHILIESWVDIQADQTIQKVHNITGLVVVIWLSVEFITGILARVIQYSQKIGTNTSIRVKRIHIMFSYLIMIIAKFNYLNIKFKGGKFDGSFIVLLIIDLAFLVVYLWLKFHYWTLSQEVIDNQLVDKNRPSEQSKIKQFLMTAQQSAVSLKDEIKQSTLKVPKRMSIQISYKSEKEIQIQNYVIFNDFVYDTSPFKQLHPGGQFVMKLVNKREIDRFMYGNYSAEMTPTVKPQNHSQDSMRLCGLPVAKLIRTSPMKGFAPFDKFSLVHIQKISTQSENYLVHLRRQESTQTPLKFQGFKQEAQIGQYFSLTVATSTGRNRCTRLYTTIWCMRPTNLRFMETNFTGSTYFSKQTVQESQTQMIERAEQQQNNLTNEEVVPFVIKRYGSGELTPRLLIQSFSGQITLSEPMGAGMKFDQINKTGKVIFVCGGTGILPFCDFIDLLFKRSKYLENSNLSGMMVFNDPLVSQDFTGNRQFTFYIGAQNLEDIPALAVYQLNDLCRSENIKVTTVMRIKKEESQNKIKYSNLTFQSSYFNNQVVQHLKQEDISQIYICGSPQMNHSIGKIMVDNKISSSLYHFM